LYLPSDVQLLLGVLEKAGHQISFSDPLPAINSKSIIKPALKHYPGKILIALKKPGLQ